MQGWLYLAVVIDFYSRKIVGWTMSNRVKSSMVEQALSMAYWHRKPGKGLIHHSDRGSQYAGRTNADIYRTRYEARSDVIDYIEMFYNSYRLHSFIGYKSPNNYEKRLIYHWPLNGMSIFT